VLNDYNSEDASLANGFCIQDKSSSIYVQGSTNGDNQILVKRGDHISFKPRRLFKSIDGFLYISEYTMSPTKKGSNKKVYYTKHESATFKHPNTGLESDLGFVRIKGIVTSIGANTDIGSSTKWTMKGGWSVHIPPLEDKAHPNVFGYKETVMIYGIVESNNTIRVYDIKNNIVRLYVIKDSVK
jgi:hypothetical protein